jgi:hypothetical protein
LLAAVASIYGSPRDQNFEALHVITTLIVWTEGKNTMCILFAFARVPLFEIVAYDDGTALFLAVTRVFG